MGNGIRARKNGNGANLGFEAELFLAADKLRKNLEPSDYKHVVLGLIFLRHVSGAFEAKRQALLTDDPQAAEDQDEYLAENVFWVPKEARWTYLQANAKQSTIGKLIDDAMQAIETNNPSLKGVLPKDYNRPALDKVMLGELIDLISGIALHEEEQKARDVLGRVYEYFLGGFAGSEGKRGGEFYTPRSVVRVLVEMLEPLPNKARGIEGRLPALRFCRLDHRAPTSSSDRAIEFGIVFTPLKEKLVGNTSAAICQRERHPFLDRGQDRLFSSPVSVCSVGLGNWLVHSDYPHGRSVVALRNLAALCFHLRLENLRLRSFMRQFRLVRVRVCVRAAWSLTRAK
jgi:HsdM N-terminal domain/N-6 DNA Methylase